MSIARDQMTGLVLAGGRGSRMGGLDKGLQSFQGTTLARHAFARLAPQVGSMMINANRNLAIYRDFGVPVWPDDPADFAGPLAGILAGLAHCSTDYLLTVPCDTPNFPLDLGARLAEGLVTVDADIAVAYSRDGEVQMPQPVFCLVKATLQGSLRDFIARGERKTAFWARTLANARVLFDQPAAFLNVNTLEELGRAERGE